MKTWLLAFLGSLLLLTSSSPSNDLHNAALNGDLKRVAADILEHPDLVNSQDENGETPLYVSAQLGNIDVIKFLLAHGADISIRDRFGTPAIVEAVDSGNLEAVRMLLRAGADPNSAGFRGTTPLHQAAEFGYGEIAEILISLGGRIDTKDDSGMNPLHNAAQGPNNNPVLGLLLNHGADKDGKDNFGETALFIAASWGRDKNAKILVDSGATWDVFSASAIGNLDEMQQFLDRNPGCVAEKTSLDETPLHFAARFSHTSAMELLLSHGAAVNPATWQGLTPLHYAAISGHSDAVSLLLSHGAEINAKDNGDMTPLHFAAKFGFLAVAKTLLSNGANVNILDKSGETPLQWAVANHHSDVADLLRQFGAK